MNAHCPQCGWRIHRSKHASIGAVRFCRSACMTLWLYEHGLRPTRAHADPLPTGVERRAS